MRRLLVTATSTARDLIDPGRPQEAESKTPSKRFAGGAIMPNEIEAEAALENCRVLIKQIIADLSAEKPLADVSSAKELRFYLERAASAFKKSVSRE